MKKEDKIMDNRIRTINLLKSMYTTRKKAKDKEYDAALEELHEVVEAPRNNKMDGEFCIEANHVAQTIMSIKMFPPEKQKDILEQFAQEIIKLEKKYIIIRINKKEVIGLLREIYKAKKNNDAERSEELQNIVTNITGNIHKDTGHPDWQFAYEADFTLGIVYTFTNSADKQAAILEKFRTDIDNLEKKFL